MGERIQKAFFQDTVRAKLTNTCIAEIQMVDRYCPCGSKFRVASTSFTVRCSTICSGVSNSCMPLNRDQRAKATEVYDLEKSEALNSIVKEPA